MNDKGEDQVTRWSRPRMSVRFEGLAKFWETKATGCFAPSERRECREKRSGSHAVCVEVMARHVTSGVWSIVTCWKAGREVWDISLVDKEGISPS